MIACLQDFERPNLKLVFFFEGPICETHKLAWKIGERDHPIFKALTKLNEGNRTCEADSLAA